MFKIYNKHLRRLYLLFFFYFQVGNRGFRFKRDNGNTRTIHSHELELGYSAAQAAIDQVFGECSYNKRTIRNFFKNFSSGDF